MLLHVELVAADREVWSGDVDILIAKTADGEVGILPNHSPLLGTLADGSVVRALTGGQQELIAAVDGGFISVADNQAQILAETAVLGQEVDVTATHTALERALATIEEDEGAIVERRRAEARLRAAGETSHAAGQAQ